MITILKQRKRRRTIHLGIEGEKLKGNTASKEKKGKLLSKGKAGSSPAPYDSWEPDARDEDIHCPLYP
jgi:hypothetical protein